MIKFTEDYLTGIPEIDREHKKLFVMIEQANSEIKSGADIRTTGMQLLNGLKDYAATHFAHEEAYMESIDDPELPRQRRAHKAFVKRLENTNFVGMADDTMREAVLDLLNYMSHWLMHHILGSDTLIGKTKSPFAFTDEYKTGIELIDSEHKKLFDIMGRVNALIHNEDLYDRFDEIVELIGELRDYTKFHFSDEEKYMAEHNYPGLDAQRKAHQGFVDYLEKIDLEEVDEDQEAYLTDLLAYLLKWLSGHILGMDKKIGEFILQ
ncbi:MAG: hemerythrin [Lachnospiraceae bacterium]|uniref:Bacteriohemerythrin n=1 Tax=Candidatus Weimeria bifida TaxID=2599074 RepID=A0A6N7J1E0_9FIRM|nr:bacteriohemerythrin [Candidatus Weimeria bifida]RRF96161.1 MAG: hemerythrin [Lachnospiraceae bacterium]